MGFLSGARKGGSTKKPKGERDKRGPAKTRAVSKVHKQQKRKDRSTRAGSSGVDFRETKSSRSTAQVGIIRLP